MWKERRIPEVLWSPVLESFRTLYCNSRGMLYTPRVRIQMEELRSAVIGR